MILYTNRLAGCSRRHVDRPDPSPGPTRRILTSDTRLSPRLKNARTSQPRRFRIRFHEDVGSKGWAEDLSGQKARRSTPSPLCLSVTLRRDSAWRPSPFVRQVVLSRGQGLYMCLRWEVYQAKMVSLRGMEDPRRLGWIRLSFHC